MLFCKSVLSEHRAEFQQIEKEKTEKQEMEQEEKKRKLEANTASAPKKPTQSSMNYYADRKLDAKEKAAFHLEILDAFVSADIPLKAIENPHLRKALKRLRPSVVERGVLPCRQTLGGLLLNKRYQIVKDDMNAALSGAEFVNLSLDAWKDINGRKILGK